jgi:hypothetical protein
LIFEPAEIYVADSGKEVGWKDNSIELDCEQNKNNNESDWESYNADTVTNSMNSNQFNNKNNHINTNTHQNTPTRPI